MINLLQENIEIKSPLTNSTPARSAGGFVFLPTCPPTGRHTGKHKKTKRAIF